jgi:23S rRNA pseudouridine1911/1915/1917 synthase
MPQHRSLPVPDGLVGERVDVAVAKLLGFSRTFAGDVIERGGVEVDGRVATKSDRLSADVLLSIVWDDPRAPEIVPVVISDMQIVYDDDDIVIVSKPPVLAAHPSLGWDGDTVLGALAGAGYRIATSGPPERQGIVHRLDVGTSGLMIVAKSEIAYSVMKRKFKDREVFKEYHALVQGEMVPQSGTIDAPIGRHPGSAWKFAVTHDGRDAITHFDTLTNYSIATLLSVGLETGRTHQIRVHMAAQRHPLVGDSLYGANPTIATRLELTRQWLHAVRLRFNHPTTGDEVEITSDYAPDLALSLELLATR